MHYELTGDPGRPVITFLNGLTQNANLWKSYAEYFVPRGYRVLAYDMLGQGRSSKPVIDINLAMHADMLDNLLEQLGIDKTHLASISFGGIIALDFAIRYGDRLHSLTAMSTFAELTPQLDLLGAVMLQGLTDVGLPYMQSMLYPMNMSSAWIAANRERIPAMKRAGYIGNDGYAMQNLMESFVAFKPLTPDLHKIKVPTLIMNGEFDFFTPRECHELIRSKVRIRACSSCSAPTMPSRWKCRRSPCARSRFSWTRSVRRPGRATRAYGSPMMIRPPKPVAALAGDWMRAVQPAGKRPSRSPRPPPAARRPRGRKPMIDPVRLRPGPRPHRRQRLHAGNPDQDHAIPVHRQERQPDVPFQRAMDAEPGRPAVHPVAISRELEAVTLLAGPRNGRLPGAGDRGNRIVAPLVIAWGQIMMPPGPMLNPQAVYRGISLGHAQLARIRLLPVIPDNADPLDPFVVALQRIEQENGRMLQTQIRLLKNIGTEMSIEEREALVDQDQELVDSVFSQFLTWLAAP